MKEKHKAVLYLAVAIFSVTLINYLRFAHGREWYADHLSNDLFALGILFITLILGAALWGLGRLVKKKKVLKAVLLFSGFTYLLGSVLAIITLVIGFFFPAARELIHFA